MKQTEANRLKVLAALRDPANQTRQIRGRYYDNHRGCCVAGLIGEVLDAVSESDERRFASPLWQRVIDRLGLSQHDHLHCDLTVLNDANKLPFYLIAEQLEKEFARQPLDSRHD